MDQIYYFVILGALLLEYGLSTISSFLNMNSITETVPKGFEDYYDTEKYSQSHWTSL